jgi:hypothetical protein
MHLSKVLSLVMAAAFTISSTTAIEAPFPYYSDIETAPGYTEKQFFKTFLQEVRVSGLAVFYTPDILKEDETIDAMFESAISIDDIVPNYNEPNFIKKEHRIFHFFQDSNGNLEMRKKIYLVSFCNEIMPNDLYELECIVRVARLKPSTSSFEGKETFLIQPSALNYFIRVGSRHGNLWYLENFIQAIALKRRDLRIIVKLNMKLDRE